MTHKELIAHLTQRGVKDARISTFDGGQTLRWYSKDDGFVAITSEWGDPELDVLARRRFPSYFPEDNPFIIEEPVSMERAS